MKEGNLKILNYLVVVKHIFLVRLFKTMMSTIKEVFLYSLIFQLTIILPADLTASKRPGSSYQIEIHFAVFNHLYLLFSFRKLVET